jgi:tetratricopeptide (TPR) repeat protein
MRLSKLLLLCLLLQACSTLPQHQLPNNIAAQSQLDVPFIAQQQYYCGPAALAEVAHFYGIDADQQSLAKQLFIPGKKGSLAIEMQASTRRLGMLPYPLDKTLSALVTELDAGHPVLVFQNLTFSWLPQWHYALAVGYDMSTKELILHSGSHAYYRMPFRTFLKTWARTNYWALVMSEPENIPTTAEPTKYIRAAYAFEQTGQPELAAEFYAVAAQRWPDSLAVLSAQANLALATDDVQQALVKFERVLQLDPENPALWNNYAYALLAASCSDAAQQAIAKAITLAPDDKQYRDSEEEISSTQALSVDACPRL